MDIRLESAEEADKAPDSDEVSPEERLQRLVLDSLRAEQEQPVDAPAVASPEPVRAETGGWRGLNLFLALVIAGAAAGGSLLLIIGQHDFGQDAPPRSTIATGPIHAASLPAPLPAALPVPLPAPLSPTVTVAPPPVPPEQPPRPAQLAVEPGAVSVQPDNTTPSHSDPAVPPSRGLQSLTTEPAKPMVETLPSPTATTASRPDVVVRPEVSKMPTVQHDAGTAASLSAARVPATVHEAEIDKPVLWVYYPFGATLAGENARTLASRIGSDVSSVDFIGLAEVPKIAVIRFSQERNVTLSKAMGKALANLGYRWRLEDGSNAGGAPHNMIEIWLPTKLDGRISP
jgi:hypothetical protein